MTKPQVPTQSGPAPLIAFVGHRPSDVDVAWQRPLAGVDGRVFADQYLDALGLAKSEVACTNIVPALDLNADDFRDYAAKELDRIKPQIVVALGQVAKSALGDRATHVLPHPAALRRRGDHRGELTRKLKSLKADITKARRKIMKRVHIAKVGVDAGLDEQLVYGVVLDPYQFDTQEDFCPARDIQTTAHGFMMSCWPPMVGFMHTEEAQAAVVESWLWPYPTKQDYQNAMQNLPHRAYKSRFGSDMVNSGAWIIGVRVFDGPTWMLIKEGKLTGFSMGGTGIRIPVADPDNTLPEVTFIEQDIDNPDVPHAVPPPDDTEESPGT